MDETQKSTPPIVLTYSRADSIIFKQGVSYERQGQVLTITISPPSFVKLILIRAIALMTFGVAALLFLSIAWQCRWYLDAIWGAIILCVMLALLWGTVRMLRRLIQTARHGRKPSTVRVWPGGLEIRTHGDFRELHVQLPRERVCDVQVHPFVAGLIPRLNLQIVGGDDSLAVVDIPWCNGFSMIEIEDNLRDVLGLPPAR